MPLVSIITPTFNRAELLPAIWDCVRAQSVHDFEWLVLDDSPRPTPMFETIGDPRVQYRHAANRMTIGAKRNALCEAAAGKTVVLFDDDDFYAPHYIARMLSVMRDSGADFVKLFGFFLYHRGHDVFAYWDLTRNLDVHYCVDPAIVAPVKYEPDGGDNRLGFGFSYVFHRRVWETVRFPPEKNWNEDGVFAGGQSPSSSLMASRTPSAHASTSSMPATPRAHFRSTYCRDSCLHGCSPLSPAKKFVFNMVNWLQTGT